ncbi:MAG TPA: ABC transporter permease [Anaeromyxobacteraceae bacterium]|nr:ABC transporter permease [Anaeromyxobacteraceae bacterium]
MSGARSPGAVARTLDRWLVPASGVGTLLGAWQVASSSGHWTPEQLPGPAAVLRAGAELVATGTLAAHVGASLARFLAAYALAAGLAVTLGLLFGWRERLWRAVDPLVQLIRPVSPIAWFPLAVLWLGIGDAPAIAIIFLAAFFPALLTTVAAVRRVDPLLLRIARNFGSRERDIVLKVVVPAAFPQVAVGLHIALGAAWVYLVAGEMLGARSGLGFLVMDARNFLRTDLLLFAVLMIGLIGLALDKAIAAVERRIYLAWGLPPAREEAP